MLYVRHKVPVRVHNYSIDSRSRDTSIYPNASRYVVDIPTPFKNVIKVELVQAIYDKYGSEKVLNLHIDELDNNLETNNNNVRGVFTQLPLIDTVNLYSGGTSNFRSVKEFERPLSKLGRMSLRFTSFDGTAYPMQDHQLRFEITTCSHSGSVENTSLGLFVDNNYDVFQPAPAQQAPPPVLPMTRTPPFPPQPPSWGSALQHHTQQQVIPPPPSSSSRAGGFPGWM